LKDPYFTAGAERREENNFYGTGKDERPTSNIQRPTSNEKTRNPESRLRPDGVGITSGNPEPLNLAKRYGVFWRRQVIDV